MRWLSGRRVVLKLHQRILRSATEFDAQFVEHTIRAPGLRRGVCEQTFLISGKRPVRLISEIVVRFRPRVLKHCFDLQLEESGHLVDLDVLWNYIARSRQNEVLAEITERPLRIRNKFPLFDRAEIARDRLDDTVNVAPVKNDHARAEQVLDLGQRARILLTPLCISTVGLFGEPFGIFGARRDSVQVPGVAKVGPDLLLSASTISWRNT